jgi:hypothetical protein
MEDVISLPLCLLRAAHLLPSPVYFAGYWATRGIPRHHPHRYALHHFPFLLSTKACRTHSWG